MAASFRFKQFSVRNDMAALKVGTDAVLLGASMTLAPEDSCLLDIGTGTGVIALMVAQRITGGTLWGETPHQKFAKTLGGTLWGETPHQKFAKTEVFAIDIDGPSAQEAALNFADSPWADGLRAIHTSLADYKPEQKFDCIFSNPPFYDNSLTNPDAREATARHTGSLSYREIFAFSAEWLHPRGRLSLILPADQETAILRTAASFGLFPFRIIRIRTTVRKPVRRIILEFSRTKQKVSDESLTLQDGNARSAQYQELTREFYL